MAAGIEQHEFTFPGEDGVAIAAYRWSKPVPTRAVLQIAHGMGEHAQRYRPALAPLLDAGIVVYASDLRGHGRTARDAAGLGDLGPGGFERLVDDIARLTGLARAEQPGKPLILLGHSMGSFAAQLYCLDHYKIIDGLVLSGSSAVDKILEAAQAAGGANFEMFNAAFAPVRTPFDWLSRDAAQVDAYIADPWCGFTLQPASMVSMFGIAARLADPAALGRIRHDLPIYVFSGDKDPVGNATVWLQTIIERYRAAGIRDISYDFYPDGRHEMLNEINADEVRTRLLAWIDRVCAARS